MVCLIFSLVQLPIEVAFLDVTETLPKKKCIKHLYTFRINLLLELIQKLSLIRQLTDCCLYHCQRYTTEWQLFQLTDLPNHFYQIAFFLLGFLQTFCDSMMACLCTVLKEIEVDSQNGYYELGDCKLLTTIKINMLNDNY